jgi:hypothetical protein
MKKNNNSRGFNPVRYESFDLSDTRYYGVFIKGHGEDRNVLIDPRRYEKICGLSEEMKSVISSRSYGSRFKPAKKNILDYNINFMRRELAKIREHWENTNKPMINHVISEISGKVFVPIDDDLAMSGILEPDEAAIHANMKTMLSHMRAKEKRATLYYSLYAQFFHQMVSQIEALFIKTLTRNGYEGDRFDRNVFYAFKGAKEEKIKELDGFAEYDKMYAIWNFIKHNSLSTYACLKDKYPDALIEGEYPQGEPACFYVEFDNCFIDTVLSGVDRFIKGYCDIVFGESENEASWNSDEHFLNSVYHTIEASENPLGIPPWI